MNEKKIGLALGGGGGRGLAHIGVLEVLEKEGIPIDMIAGQEIIINQGSVLEAVRASVSMPIIFTVVKLKGRYLVDGGLSDPVPVNVLKDMGADFIIAVNVTPRLMERQKRVYLEESDAEGSSAKREPNIFNIIMKMFSITNSQVVEASFSGADVIIEPRMAGIGFGDFGHIDECILEGGLSTIDAVLEIKRRLAA